MRLRPRTLRGRLTLWYTAVLAIVLIAFGTTTYLMAVEEEREEALHAEVPATPIDRRLLIALGVGLPAAMIVAVAGGLWMSRRALAPIDEVVRVASNLDAENLALRIPTRAGDAQEVQRLSGAINAMLDRIERSVGGLRRFTADASHELRTPVATVMGNLEVALRRPREPAELRATMEAALEELGRLTRLVESLLTLARSDAGELPLERKQIEVRNVIEGVLEPYQEIAIERGIRLESDCDVDVTISADPLWLGRAVANLVDNACKFAPRGGRVMVRVETQKGRVRICVEDDGPGLSDAERARAFERFYRAETVRGVSDGFGLGLPLAKEIVRAMEGELVLQPRSGGGTVASVELPTAG